MAINGRRLKGTNGNDRLEGGKKNDRLDGLGGNDELFGKTGADKLYGGENGDLLYGGKGADMLFGGSGNDEIFGGSGDDYINPGSNPGAGDVIAGSTGDDTIEFVRPGGSYALDYSRLIEGMSAVIRNKSGSVDKGASGTDTVLGAKEITDGFTFVGGQGDDAIRINLSGAKFVRLSGGAGDNTLTGGRSFDTLEFQADGDAGVSVKVDGRDADGFFGTATNAFGGTDTFRAIDAVGGSDANDTLLGSSVPDRFVASAGADVFDGGRGLDRISYNAFEIREVVVDLAAGTATADFRGGERFVDSLTSIEGVLGSRSGDDKLLGSGADERLETRDGDNVLKGGGGSDVLLAGQGKDKLFGGAGDDALDGGNGRDTLDGGRGDDDLSGDAGPDTFVVKRTSGDDAIADFTTGVDTIQIDSGADAFGDLTLVGRSGSTTISFDDVSIFLEDVRKASITEDDFSFG